MKGQPLVSIIIPVYKVEKFIEGCARSLFNQDLDDIEYVFIDDCTPDQSMEVLKGIVDEYHSRIVEKNWIVRMEKMPQNSGQAAVRQYGLKIATGDYIIHCDSDDYIEHDMISEMWKKAHQDNLDVVVCDYNHIQKNKTIRHKGMNTSGIDEFYDEVASIFASWSLCNKLFRRSLYTNNILFPLKGMNVGEDMAVVIQLLYFCKNVGYIEKPFYNYIDNGASISNKKDISGIINNYIQWVANICLLESFFKDKDIYDKMNRKLSYVVVFATDETLTKLDSVGKSMTYLIFRLCLNVWRTKDISRYGKERIWRYMKKLLFSSIKNKLSII